MRFWTHSDGLGSWASSYRPWTQLRAKPRFFFQTLYDGKKGECMGEKCIMVENVPLKKESKETLTRGKIKKSRRLSSNLQQGISYGPRGGPASDVFFGQFQSQPVDLPGGVIPDS